MTITIQRVFLICFIHDYSLSQLMVEKNVKTTQVTHKVEGQERNLGYLTTRL